MYEVESNDVVFYNITAEIKGVIVSRRCSLAYHLSNSCALYTYIHGDKTNID
jgi:hypothetical protein